jgi:hypothetical protein
VDVVVALSKAHGKALRKISILQMKFVKITTRRTQGEGQGLKRENFCSIELSERIPKLSILKYLLSEEGKASVRGKHLQGTIYAGKKFCPNPHF